MRILVTSSEVTCIPYVCSYPQRGRIAIHTASSSNKPEVIQLLLQSGAQDMPDEVCSPHNDLNYVHVDNLGGPITIVTVITTTISHPSKVL